MRGECKLLWIVKAPWRLAMTGGTAQPKLFRGQRHAPHHAARHQPGRERGYEYDRADRACDKQNRLEAAMASKDADEWNRKPAHGKAEEKAQGIKAVAIFVRYIAPDHGIVHDHLPVNRRYNDREPDHHGQT